MRTQTVLVALSIVAIGACSHSAPATSTPTAEASPPPAAQASAETSGSESESAPTPTVATTPEIHHHHHAADCGEVRVTFASGSSDLDADAQQHLNLYAACVESERARVLYVLGTTDPAGSEQDNVVLAHARGSAVAAYLHGVGCHTDFEIHAVGEAGALASRQVWPIERAATVSDARPH